MMRPRGTRAEEGTVHGVVKEPREGRSGQMRSLATHAGRRHRSDRRTVVDVEHARPARIVGVVRWPFWAAVALPSPIHTTNGDRKRSGERIDGHRSLAYVHTGPLRGFPSTVDRGRAQGFRPAMGRARCSPVRPRGPTPGEMPAGHPGARQELTPMNLHPRASLRRPFGLPDGVALAFPPFSLGVPSRHRLREEIQPIASCRYSPATSFVASSCPSSSSAVNS